MKTFAISVITPTFNRADMLPQVLRSITQQSFTDFEHIIVDDGSTDETKAVVEKFRSDYGERELVYFYQQNAGEANAVNAGWQQAKGRYVVIVNSDDPQPPELLPELFNFMEDNPDVTVGYPDWTTIDDHGRKTQEKTVKEFDPDLILLKGKCLPGPGAVLRTSHLKDISKLRDPRFPLVSDLSCWLMLCAQGKKFKRIPKNIACWREHEAGLTTAIKRRRHARDFFQLYKTFWAENTNVTLKNKKNESLMRTNFLLGKILIKNQSENIYAFPYFLQAGWWGARYLLQKIYSFFTKGKKHA